MWSLTLYAGNWEVIFGFLLPRMGLNSSWRATRDLVLPEEGHHERLFGAGPPPTHQTYPACGQRAVWGGVGGLEVGGYTVLVAELKHLLEMPRVTEQSSHLPPSPRKGGCPGCCAVGGASGWRRWWRQRPTSPPALQPLTAHPAAPALVLWRRQERKKTSENLLKWARVTTDGSQFSKEFSLN